MMVAALAAVALIVGVVGTTEVVTHPPRATAEQAIRPVVTVQGVRSDAPTSGEHKARGRHEDLPMEAFPFLRELAVGPALGLSAV
jgi:hypothetical protein